MSSIKKFILELIYPTRLIPGKVSQQQMLKLGATGTLSSAFERFIPLDKIKGLDPEPATWVDDSGVEHNFEPGGKIIKSIEVIYDADDDTYYLQNGNHRIKQARVDGDSHIRAFIQPDRGQIGTSAKLYL